jgi:hypothetical protein
MGSIARISQAFQDSHVEFPVLSVYEQRVTKINSTFMSSKREILVNQSLARTSAKYESLVGADKDHLNICHLSPNDLVLVELKDYFERADGSVVRAALETLQPENTSVAWTATMSEFPDPAIVPAVSEPEFPSTQGATAGMSVDMSSFDFLPLREPVGGIVQTVKLPQYMLKPHMRNADFFGRKDILQTLRRALAPSTGSSESDTGSALRSFALCGVGGLGKTSIAVEYAYATKDLYEAIFVLQASDTEKLAQSFAEMSVALGLETEAGDQIISKNIVLGWLSQPVRHIQEGTAVFANEMKDLVSWLIVFDNADDLNVLRDFWPQSERGSILVTSRDPLAKTRTHVPITEGLDLEPFSPKDAGLLLRNLTNYSNSADVTPSEAVGARLSGLPLALTQIAGTITRRDLSFPEFLALYDQESARSEIHKTSVQFAAKTLYTVWSFEDLGPGAKSLLEIIAFLDPDQIAEVILMKMGEVEERHRPEAYPDDESAFVNARSELTKSSLLKRNRDRSEVIIHRIVQNSVKMRMGIDLFKVRFSSAALLLYATWPFSEFEHSTTRWRLCEPIIAHVANLHRTYVSNDELQGSETARSELARLFMDFGW